MLLPQSEAEGRACSGRGLAAAQDNILAVKPVQDVGRASPGLTVKCHHVALESPGPRRAEGQDRTRHGN